MYSLQYRLIHWVLAGLLPLLVSVNVTDAELMCSPSEEICPGEQLTCTCIGKKEQLFVTDAIQWHTNFGDATLICSSQRQSVDSFQVEIEGCTANSIISNLKTTLTADDFAVSCTGPDNRRTGPIIHITVAAASDVSRLRSKIMSNGSVTIQWTYTHAKCIHNATVLITDSNGGVRHDLITGDKTSYEVLDVGLDVAYIITITPSTALGAITSMSTGFTVESKVSDYPRHVQVDPDCSNRKLNVTWEVPPPNPQAPPPSHYLLIGTVGLLSFSKSTLSTSYMVDIMEGDEYSLTVHAVNSVGVGPGSLPNAGRLVCDDIEDHTKEDLPTAEDEEESTDDWIVGGIVVGAIVVGIIVIIVVVIITVWCMPRRGRVNKMATV